MHANSIIFPRKKDLRVQHFPQCDVKHNAGISMWLRLYIIYIRGQRSGDCKHIFVIHNKQEIVVVLENSRKFKFTNRNTNVNNALEKQNDVV